MMPWAYVFNKLKNDPTYLDFDDLGKEDEAKDTFRAIRFNEDLTAEQLNNWCKKYLQDKQLNSLRAALRQKEIKT